MNKPVFQITLSPHENEIIESILNDVKSDPQVLLRARVLQLSNIKDPKPLQINEIAKIAGTSKQTVIKLRRIYQNHGFDIAITVRQRGGYDKCKKNDDVLLDHIKDIIAEPPHDGRKRWTLQTICDECQRRGYVSSISAPTVMKILKKNNIQL